MRVGNVSGKNYYWAAEADPGGELWGVAALPLGIFQTCLVTDVYPFFIPKIILQVII